MGLKMAILKSTAKETGLLKPCGIGKLLTFLTYAENYCEKDGEENKSYVGFVFGRACLPFLGHRRDFDIIQGGAVGRPFCRRCINSHYSGVTSVIWKSPNEEEQKATIYWPPLALAHAHNNTRYTK